MGCAEALARGTVAVGVPGEDGRLWQAMAMVRSPLFIVSLKYLESAKGFCVGLLIWGEDGALRCSLQRALAARVAGRAPGRPC